MNQLGQPVQADVRVLVQPREGKERQSLLTRIYNLEYIAIPALQRDYQQHVEQRRDPLSMDQALMDSKQAMQLAQDSLMELKRELLNLEARPQWNFLKLFDARNTRRWRLNRRSGQARQLWQK